ncbi:MAG: hypothetical protein KC925_00170 [Candidatus Doudnabacteria bacterium]|nr:hypothetical protein [Candidatus Doudnabacteria bacterium]
MAKIDLPETPVVWVPPVIVREVADWDLQLRFGEAQKPDRFSQGVFCPLLSPLPDSPRVSLLVGHEALPVEGDEWYLLIIRNPHRNEIGFVATWQPGTRSLIILERELNLDGPNGYIQRFRSMYPTQPPRPSAPA